MSFELNYGPDTVVGDAPWTRLLAVLDIADVPELARREEAIAHAIEHPIGLDKNLYELVAPGETVAILVSDAFRYTCADQFLPILINGLNRAGIPDSAITIIFATGTHRAPRPEEQARILGPEIFRRFAGRAYVHEPCNEANLTFVGTTARGTQVRINRRAHEADRLIATGAVVFHYFGGFGGGRKSIVPGIASVDTISQNHSINLDPREDRLNPHVRIGVVDGNPVAEDMLEAARLAGVDYIVNTVLNRRAQIADIFAGELDTAHRAASALARTLFTVPITERADLVIASAGSARNYVQSHKALYNAYQAVKPTGRIVFLAKCEEGLGGESFAKWARLKTREAIIAGLRKQSEINGQTALSTIEKTPISIFVTDMAHTDVETIGARKAASLQEALEWAKRDLERISNPTCYVMPSASYTVPMMARTDA